MTIKDRIRDAMNARHQVNTQRAKENIIPTHQVKTMIRDVFGDLNRMICCTIGPGAGNTLVTEPYATTPIFPTKDGFRVMNNHNYDDVLYESIYRIIRDICGRMNTAVGDGTTSGIPIGNRLYNDITRYMAKNRKITPYGIKRLLDEILIVISAYLKEHGYVQSIKDLPKSAKVEIYRKIATISANNDSTIADIVTEAYTASDSEYTFVDIQESMSEKDEIDTNLGFELTSGYILRHMANHSDGINAEYQNPLFLLIDGPIIKEDVDPLRQFIEWGCISQQRPMVVVASEYCKEAMDLFVQCCSAYPIQTARGVQAVKLPLLAIIVNTFNEYGVSRMGDLEAALGAVALQTNNGRLQNCPKNETEFMMLMGRADSVSSKPHYTRVRGGAGSKEKREARIAEITKLIDAASTGGTKGLMEMTRIETLKRRAGMLRGEMHCIKVGGDSFKEKQSRSLIYEDAVMAVRSCITAGVTLGGNVSIRHCIRNYKKDMIRDIISVLTNGKTYNVLIGGDIHNVEKALNDLMDIIAEGSTAAFRAVFKNATNDNGFIRKTFDRFKKDKVCYSYDLIKGKYQAFPMVSESNSLDVFSYNGTEHQLETAYAQFIEQADVSETKPFIDDEFPSLLVPGNTDVELLRSVFSILGLFFTSNQLLTVHVQKNNKV